MKYYARYDLASGHILGEVAIDFGAPFPPTGEGIVALETAGGSDGKYVADGVGLVDREPATLPGTMTVEPSAEFTVELPAGAWFTMHGEAPQQATGVTAFTLDTPGTYTLELLGRYSGRTVITIMDLAAAKQAARDRINVERDRRRDAGCMTGKGPIDTDPASRGLLNGAVSMAMVAKMSAQPFELGFTMADQTTPTFTADEIIAAGVAVGQFIDQVHQQALALKAQIDAATTLAEVEAVQWPSA